jgi:hypothetical protein
VKNQKLKLTSEIIIKIDHLIEFWVEFYTARKEFFDQISFNDLHKLSEIKQLSLILKVTIISFIFLKKSLKEKNGKNIKDMERLRCIDLKTFIL